MSQTAIYARELTRSAVLRLIAEHGAISRSGLADELGLSRSTVTRAVASLLEEGFIQEGRAVGSRVGRKHILLELNPGHISFIGLDLAGQRMRGALADLRGVPICRIQSEPIKTGDGSANLGMLDELIKGILRHAQGQDIRVSGIGIGAPATGLATPNVHPVWAERLGWEDPRLEDRIRDMFGLRAYIENDGDLGAISERWLGAGKGVDDLVYLAVGQGIGGGVIIGGQLQRGHHHAAGTPGSIVPDPRYLGRDYTRSFGCLESLASEAAVVAQAWRAIAAGEPSLLAQADGLSLPQVLQAAEQGDSLAARLADGLAEYLAIAVVAIASLLDPQMIVVGGYLGDGAEGLLQRIRARTECAVRAMPALRLSALGDDAVLLGAIALAQQGEFAG
jgi:predicted NBD/HSP70 family sugar kinase/biotin operon repressor